MPTVRKRIQQKMPAMARWSLKVSFSSSVHLLIRHMEQGALSEARLEVLRDSPIIGSGRSTAET